MNSLFDEPALHAVVTGRTAERIGIEAATLGHVLQRYKVESGRARVLDLACRDGALAVRLAEAGYTVAAADPSRAMLERARAAADHAGVALDLYEGDAARADCHAGRFDAACWAGGGFATLTGYPELAAHFDAVRRCVKKRGVYIVGRSFPPAEGRHERRVAVDGGTVSACREVAANDRAMGTVRITLEARDDRSNPPRETRDTWEERLDTPFHLELLARSMPGWTLAGFVSWRGFEADLLEDDDYLMVLERTD